MEDDQEMTTTPSPQTGKRWPRSESIEAEAQQEQKRLKHFAVSLCREKGLPEDALEDFSGVSGHFLLSLIANN